MGDARKNAKLLKSFGVADWVLCDDEMQNFIDWFENNIDESNILTDNELAEYQEIVNSGNMLTGESLAQELRKIENNFPNILSYTDQDVSRLDAELQHVRCEAKANEDLAEQIRSSVTETVGTIAELESQVNRSETEVQAMIRTCFESAQQLEDMQSENQRLTDELHRTFSKEQTKPLFMHQMPVEREFLQICSTFIGTVNLYMQNNFKFSLGDDTTAGNVPAHNADVTAALNQFDAMTRCFYEVMQSILINRMECHAARALNEEAQMRQSLTQSITSGSLAQSIADMCSVSDPLSRHIETSLETVRLQLKQLAEHEIEFIVAQNNAEKLRRATQRLEELKKMANCVSGVLSNADLLWVTLQLDFEKIKAYKSVDKTNRLRTEAVQSDKRLASIHSLVQQPNVTDTLFRQKLQTLLAAYVSSTPSDLAECWQAYAKLMKQIPLRLDGIVGGHHLTAATKQMDKLTLAEKILHNSLVTGPSKKAVLCHALLVSQLHVADKDIQWLQKQIKALQIDLVNHGTRMRNDEFWRNKMLLWVWFLVEPKLVCDAIRDVKKKLKAIEEQPLPQKTLAGLRRKP